MKYYHFVNKDYVDRQKSDATYLTFSSLDELTQITKDYYGKSLFLSPEKDFQIKEVTILAWSKIFIPYANGYGDMIGFSIYPTADSCYCIGHTSGGWFVRQIY